MSLIYKILTILFLFKFFFFTLAFATTPENNFDDWLISYKKNALQKGISQETINIAFKNVKFLKQVIRYDRKQPEFFEDTITYVGKRATILRARKAKELLNKNIHLFKEDEKKFGVEKEIL